MIDEKIISKILIQEDPMGIYFPSSSNFDEYNSEAKLIAQKISNVREVRELTNVIWEIFKKRFGEVEAGDKENYITLSKKILKEALN
jgi:hypothetical protein